MTTPELLNYIRNEITKGKTREDIHRVLMSNGGWTEDDLSEAFRVIIPMGSVIMPTPISPVLTPVSAPAPNPILQTPTAPISTPVSSFQPREIKPQEIKPVVSSPSFVPPPPPPTIIIEPKIIRPEGISNPKSVSSSHFLLSFLKFLVILVIVAGLGLGFWYYHSQIKGEAVSLWSSLMSKIKGVQTSTSPNMDSTTGAETAPVVQTTPTPVMSQVIHCGISASPDLGTASTYENNSTLTCLGENALNCENAEGTLTSDLFPTVFEITKSVDSCNFTLSYPVDSTLTNVAGQKLAGQDISCPISIVKSTNNTKAVPIKFIAPNTTDLSKYATEIYFYGTLGVFADNNLNQNKIQALGCSGDYIGSAIASYNYKKTK